jgi:hypothetical protein
MFDFIFSNPVVLIFLIYALFRIFGSKGRKEREAKLKQARQQVQPQMQQKVKNTSFQDRLEEAMRQAGISIDQGTLTTGQPSTSVPVTTAPSAAAASAPAADDPYAFHSASDRIAERIPERVDYDLKQEAFEFHPVTREPVEQEYHLTGFSGFREAHGLSSLRRPAVQSGEPAVQPAADLSLFRRPDDLRRAIIINEILGKPKSLRHRGS